MACFIVAAAEAVVVTIAAQTKKKQEQQTDHVTIESTDHISAHEAGAVSIPWSRKLMWLAYLLWGGVVLLTFEHVWHGEVVPWFPFLTAASNPADLTEMLHEMATVGVTMICLVTAVWVCLVAVVTVLSKKVAGHEAETAK